MKSKRRRCLGTCAGRGIDESTSPQGRREAELARHKVEINSSPKYHDQLPAIIKKLIAVAERLGRTTEAAKLRRLLR